MDACGVFAAAIAKGIRTGDRDAMLRIAQSYARTGVVTDVLGRAVQGEAPADYRTDMGWVLIALQNAFCRLQRGETVEEALIATVGKGGDTDTNAAIAGALLGSADALSTIPQRWIMPIQACRPHGALGAHNPRPMTYWPDDLAAIAEALLVTRPRPRSPPHRRSHARSNLRSNPAQGRRALDDVARRASPTPGPFSASARSRHCGPSTGTR